MEKQFEDEEIKMFPIETDFGFPKREEPNKDGSLNIFSE